MDPYYLESDDEWDFNTEVKKKTNDTEEEEESEEENEVRNYVKSEKSAAGSEFDVEHSEDFPIEDSEVEILRDDEKSRDGAGKGSSKDGAVCRCSRDGTL